MISSLPFWNWFVCLSLLPASGLMAKKPAWTVENPLIFTDEQAVIRAETAPEEVPVEAALLTLEGWQHSESRTLDFQSGQAVFSPLGEGINRVQAADKEVRFLAMAPPAPLNAEAVRQILPRNADKLLSGKPFTIFATGDSVTATGDYPEMLARMLRRATGNENITLKKRGYSGRSVDASVRKYAEDVVGLEPSLVLIMYGLNDQGANSPMAAYLEQEAWLVERMREDFNADVLLLEPTPHIHILKADKEGELPSQSSIFRTITYAGALEELGKRLQVPVVPTFDAIWTTGAADLPATARLLWPLFPTHYSKPLTSLDETEGAGDTIHPNALGHLQMARATYHTINGQTPQEPLTLEAFTQWVGQQVRTSMLITNVSDKPRQGTLSLYPLPQVDIKESFDYVLEPGASAEFSFDWPDVKNQYSLLEEPLRTVFRAPELMVQAVITSDAHTRVTAIPAPWRPVAHYLQKRYVVEEPTILLEKQLGDDLRRQTLHFPADQPVGRISIAEGQYVGGEPVFLVAELGYTQFGGADSGEAVVDGQLDEWSGSRWVPVGEPVQARWTSGARDLRQAREDAYLEWSFRAGEKGLYLAFKGTSNGAKNNITVMFDPREPELLGSAGPYYWVSAALKEDGSLSPRAGDSSPSSEGLEGRWTKSDSGLIEGELFVPYAVMRTDAWPESGDLGLSIIWQHVDAEGNATYLLWAEDGHPWNTRWFGVVRRDPEAPLPYRVRIE